MAQMVIFALLFTLVLVNSQELDIDRHWKQFKALHQKSYTGPEENYRRNVFTSNLLKIIKHNIETDLGLHSFRLGVNKFADLTQEEFSGRFKGLKGNQKPSRNVFKPTGVELPETVDWRNKGLVTGVKDQGQCGSCWAFSAVASLEGQHAKATGKLVSLSEQNLVDCSAAEGNDGCEGGLMDQAFDYIKKNHGIDTEKSYPYLAVDAPCNFNRSTIGATLKGWKDIKSGSEKALQEAAATIGPISVAIDASLFSFQLYSGGIYNEPECSSTNLDHGVTVVGYGTDEKSGQDYWLVKNSWGSSWGEKGYIRMIRNLNNRCGLATQASYPLV